LFYRSIELSDLPSDCEVVLDEALYLPVSVRKTVAEIRSEHKANALELPANRGKEQDSALKA
jgi:hypothetical protein